MLLNKLDYFLTYPPHQGWGIHSTIEGWQAAVLLSHSDGRIAGVVDLSQDSMLYYGPEQTLMLYRVKIDHIVANENGKVTLREYFCLVLEAPDHEHRTSQVDALCRYVDEYNDRINRL